MRKGCVGINSDRAIFETEWFPAGRGAGPIAAVRALIIEI